MWRRLVPLVLGGLVACELEPMDEPAGYLAGPPRDPATASGAAAAGADPPGASQATGGANTCFPLEAQRVSLLGGNFGDDPLPPAPFGWIYLNLNHTLAAGDPYPGVAQNRVSTDMKAEGRFEVGFDAIQLDNLTATNVGGVVLLP